MPRPRKYYDSDESDDEYAPPPRQYRPEPDPRQPDRRSRGDRYPYEVDDRIPPPPVTPNPPRQKPVVPDPPEAPSGRPRRRAPSPTLDDSDDDERSPRHQPRARRRPKSPPQDDGRPAREDRDMYGLDEGEIRKIPRNGKPEAGGGARRAEVDDRDPPPRRHRRGEDDLDRELPVRTKTRDLSPARDEPPLANAGRPRRPQSYAPPDPYDSRGPPRDRRPAPRRYDDEDDYEPPRRRDRERSGYKSDGPDPRRRRSRYDEDEYEDDRYPPRRRDDGYRSDRRRDVPPPKPRYDDYYSDHRDDRGYRRGGRKRYPDERDRRDRYDRDPRDRYDRDPRDRYDRDPRDDRYRDRDGRTKKEAADWQEQVKSMFMKHGLPVIKKEGGRLLQKEVAKFLASQGSK